MEAAFTGGAQVGRCRLELRLAQVEAAWESHVAGELRLTGGDDEQVINRLEVVLTNPPDGAVVGPESPFYMDAARFETVTVPARRELVLPFSLRMGWGVGFTAVIHLRVTAQFGFLGLTQVVTAIRPLPPPDFTLIAEAAGVEARLAVGAWGCIGSGDGASVTFKVGDAMRDVFDGLSLRLFRSAGIVYGELCIDPQEHNLRDRLRAAAGLGVATVDLRLRAGDREGARAFFREHLRPYVNAVRHLPIPADRFRESDGQLPLPSDPPEHRE
jgi:hypothetical protein